MTVKEAHSQICQWYPDTSHSIEVEYWHHVHEDGEPTQRTMFAIYLATEGIGIRANGFTLRSCVLQLAPENETDPLDEADAFTQHLTEFIADGHEQMPHISLD